MEKAPADLVSPEWVDTLIAATLGAAPTAALDAFLDRALCAKMIHATKLGASFRLGGDEAPELWIADRGEVERIRGLAVAKWPAAKAFVERCASLDQVFCTDGERLRVFANERDKVAGPGGHRVLAWEWNDGVEGVITLHEGAPLALLPAELSTRASALGGQVQGGLWGCRWVDDKVVGVNWTSEGAGSAALAAVFVAMGSGKRFKTAYGAFSGSDLVVHPWFVELDAAGGGRVSMWGVARMIDRSHLPGIFADGAVPSAEAFAAELAAVVAPSDAAAALSLLRDELYPQLVRTRPADTDPGRHMAEVWNWLVGLLGLEVPADRLNVLKCVTVSSRLAAMQGDAFHLAVARYLASHPDAAPPATLPPSFVGMAAEAVVAAASTLRPEFDALELAASGDAEFDLHRYPRAVFELPTIKELLERAVGGEFQAASGPLHEYLQDLGRLGYDDDPSLVTIDNVDLDATDRDAVIEEALASNPEDKA